LFSFYLSATEVNHLTFSASHMLRLLTIFVITPTHLTSSVNYTCVLSIGTNILLVF